MTSNFLAYIAFSSTGRPRIRKSCYIPSRSITRRGIERTRYVNFPILLALTQVFSGICYSNHAKRTTFEICPFFNNISFFNKELEGNTTLTLPEPKKNLLLTFTKLTISKVYKMQFFSVFLTYFCDVVNQKRFALQSAMR